MANLNLNKAIIGGRLTATPELKMTASGICVCAFGVAVSRRGQKDGEMLTDFINCIAWRQNAEFLAKYFKKGSSVCVTGAIQTRTWTDKNGTRRYVTEVIAEEIGFVDAKGDGVCERSLSQSRDEEADELPF